MSGNLGSSRFLFFVEWFRALPGCPKPQILTKDSSSVPLTWYIDTRTHIEHRFISSSHRRSTMLTSTRDLTSREQFCSFPVLLSSRPSSDCVSDGWSVGWLVLLTSQDCKADA